MIAFRSGFGKAAALCVFAMAASAGLDAADARQPRPNVILVLADDIGISGIGCYGSDSFETPHIDQLAADGLRFNSGFSQPICGPSRITLMTGRYPFRTGGTANASSEKVDPAKETPFPRLLRQAGYATFATGKWPWLGHMEKADAWGFDEMLTWRSYNTPDRYWNPNLFHNGEKKSFPGKYGPDVMQDAIFDFIDRVRAKTPDRPFFVYYPSPLPHLPFVHTPDSESADITPREKYRDMVLYMDKQIGDMRRRLEERGLAKGTLLIFAGDNGSLGSHREVIDGKVVDGGKGDIAEGGVRVPWICCWPAAIKPGRVTDELVDLSDVFPTLLELTGAEKPRDLQLDGASFAPLLLGKEHHGREWVFYQHAKSYAVRERSWKLDHTGRLFDMRKAPHVETSVDFTESDAAQAAYKRLKAVFKTLDP